MKIRKFEKDIIKTVFSPTEISRIWEAKDTNPYYTVILMFIYTGCRVSELLDLKKTEVDLESRCFKILEAKTAAGIRTVPIAEKIVPFFEYWYNLNDCEYLLSTPEGRHFEYRNYYDSYWTPLIETLNINHRPHDTRHTCISMLAAAGVDERIVNSIVGHPCLHGANLAEMLDAINKI